MAEENNINLSKQNKLHVQQEKTLDCGEKWKNNFRYHNIKKLIRLIYLC